MGVKTLQKTLSLALVERNDKTYYKQKFWKFWKFFKFLVC